MNEIRDLEPKEVWRHFLEICKVPRPSKKEEKIIKFLVDFAAAHHLECHTDAIGNVLIRKPATPGCENMQSVVLQSHMDMVCEKNSDVKHDFLSDPIEPYLDGNWVKARGTTLGADDGIGIAAEMAILTSTTIQHGPLECLFTVDEETGLTGANHIEPGFFNSKILLNLDSEDEGELFIGCAGGVDTLATFNYQPQDVPAGAKALQITVKGLLGGHSGDDINKFRGNAVKLLNRFLWLGTHQFDMKIATVDAGNLRNAIAREAVATCTVSADKMNAMVQAFEALRNDILNECLDVEPSLTIDFKEVAVPQSIIDTPTQLNLVNAVYACPHGVIDMSRQLKGLVETSTNLASIKMMPQQKIMVTTSQRSSVDTQKVNIANMVESVFRLAGAKVEHSDGYPGWAPNTDSEILRITRNSYNKLFKVEPIVRAIHAGLECGLFLEKFPGLDMISFGPTLRGVHSPDEKIDVETTVKFWNLLLDVLLNIPKK